MGKFRGLNGISKKIATAQKRPLYKRIISIKEDQSLISHLKEDLNNALNQFYVSWNGVTIFAWLLIIVVASFPDWQSDSTEWGRLAVSMIEVVFYFLMRLPCQPSICSYYCTPSKQPFLRKRWIRRKNTRVREVWVWERKCIPFHHKWAWRYWQNNYRNRNSASQRHQRSILGARIFCFMWISHHTYYFHRSHCIFNRPESRIEGIAGGYNVIHPRNQTAISSNFGQFRDVLVQWSKRRISWGA